jgi:hypothetical protein
MLLPREDISMFRVSTQGNILKKLGSVYEISEIELQVEIISTRPETMWTQRGMITTSTLVKSS